MLGGRIGSRNNTNLGEIPIMIKKTLSGTVLLALSLTVLAISQPLLRDGNEPKDSISGDSSLRLTQRQIEHTLTRNGFQPSSTSTSDCQTFYTDCQIACRQEFGNEFDPPLATCLNSCLMQFESCKS